MNDYGRAIAVLYIYI